MSDRGFLLDVSDVAVEHKDSISSGLPSLTECNSDPEEREKAEDSISFRQLTASNFNLLKVLPHRPHAWQ